MAISVAVPKNLSGIKTKVAMNLTKRQLICFGGAGAVGVPFYLFTKGVKALHAQMDRYGQSYAEWNKVEWPRVTRKGHVELAVLRRNRPLSERLVEKHWGAEHHARNSFALLEGKEGCLEKYIENS